MFHCRLEGAAQPIASLVEPIHDGVPEINDRRDRPENENANENDVFRITLAAVLPHEPGDGLADFCAHDLILHERLLKS